jgi:hypothetical protein
MYKPKVCLLFGLSGSGMVQKGWSSNTSRNAFQIASNRDVIRNVGLSKLESVVGCLLDVIKYGSDDDNLVLKWRYRWISLVAASCFVHNPALQSRSFVSLVCFCQLTLGCCCG